MIIERNNALQINDIVFAVGATEISIQTDSLNYQFQPLRSATATKIPSGSNGAVVNFKILVPKEDILRMHRLIIEIQNTPFIYAEALILRNTFCPSWSSDQNMAFTVLSVNVESVVGVVGLNEINIQAQWFNYFPYVNNFLFREEWETKWIKAPSDAEYNLYKKSIYNYITKTYTKNPDQQEMLNDLKIDDMLSDWKGFLFDLDSYPSHMEQASAVANPLQSKIYVRYYNQLQADALNNNFAIDIETEIDSKLFYDNLLSGNTTLPEYLDKIGMSEDVHTRMLSFDYFTLSYKVFKYVTLPPSMLDAIGNNLGKLINDKTSGEQVLSETATVDNNIPDLIKSNVMNYETLLTLNPSFRKRIFDLLTDMINGDVPSGIEYKKGTEYQIKISQGYRAPTSAYGAKNSWHSIQTPDGAPDSFAIDLGLVNTGIWGNHLVGNSAVGVNSAKEPGYPIETLLAKGGDKLDAMRVQWFHFDYGYLAKVKYGRILTWGGGIYKEYDQQNSLLPNRLYNSKKLLSDSLSPYIGLAFSKGKTIPDNFLKLIYPDGIPGGDNVHSQYREITIEDKVLGPKLYSGWRPDTDSSGNPLYNTTSGSYIDYDGNTVPWYDFYKQLDGKPATEDDERFFAIMKDLYQSGWRYYNKDPGVNGILEKTIEITVPTTAGNIQLDTNGQLVGVFDGGPTDLNTVFTKYSGTLKHIVSSLPIIGHEYPTHQHLGSLDADYAFEFITQDRGENSKRDGLGLTAQLLETARNELHRNARDLKIVYDSWMADVDTFITRLFGSYFYLASYPNDDVTSNHYPDIVRKHKKLIINTSNVNTIQGNPGLVSYLIGCTDTKPYCGEELKKTLCTNNAIQEKVYKKIVSKFFDTAEDTIFSPLEQQTIAQRRVAETYKKETMGSAEPGKDVVHGLLSLGMLFDDHFKYGLAANAKENETFRTTLDLDYLGYASVNTYTDEEQRKLEALYRVMSTIRILAELILLEERFNGLKISDQELYGYESHINPKMERFVFTEINNSWLSALRDNAQYFEKFWEDVKEREDKLYEKSNEPLTIASTSYWATASGYISLIAGLEKEGAGLLLVEMYLKDLIDLSNQADLTFVGTFEIIPYALNSFFSFDKLEINNDTYGFQSTLMPYIELYNKYGKRPSDTSVATEQELQFGKLEYENNKLDFIKNLIIETCKKVMMDPFLSIYFDISEDLAKINTQMNTDEDELLKDMNLPEHPFYNKKYLTPPDFYYFNYYEDGQYKVGEYLNRLYRDSMKDYTESTYDFMTKLKEGQLSLSAQSGDLTGYEVHGAFEGANNPIDDDFDSLSGGAKPYGFFTPEDYEGDPDKITFDGHINSGTFLASITDEDGIYKPQTSQELIDKLQSIEMQFGKKEGYANEREEIVKIVDNVAFSSDTLKTSSYVHSYGKEDINSIAQESIKDLVSSRFSMRAAFPTFRVYIIEEDQSEDFLFKYDDFYHYNAIKEITVVKSREISADTAIIVMQNISGLLDGSKRRAIKDTDYLYDNRKDDGSFTEKGKKIEEGRKHSNEDTLQEEPFDSVVLRPGMNIQIRTGYGNNPNLLEVKLSGRIVDLQFSDNSDLVEVVVQSFGVELEQQQKNSIGDESNIFNLTHKILGSLMLSPELIHFGRFEFGINTQFGEFKDQSLDFKIYNDHAAYNVLTTYLYGNTSDEIRDTYYLNKGLVLDHIKTNALTSGLDGISPVKDIKGLYHQSEQGIETFGSFLWDAGTLPYHFADLVYDKMFSILENSAKEKIAYALNTPQDDNLFPPNPKDYVVRPNWIYASVKDSIKKGWQSGSVLKGLARLTRNITQGVITEKSTIEELNYSFNGLTIFQIFHEMTLRHPGYVYGAMPYGKDFRYTMFFGVPSQRYWSKPAHPLFIKRANDLRAALSGPMNDSATIEDKSILKTHTFDELKTWLKINYEDEKMAMQTSSNQQVNTSTDQLKSLGINSLEEGLLEYYNALTYRFEPFRRYHYASSNTDIIMNNLILSDYNVANAVAVKYSTVNGDNETELEDQRIVKIHENISDNDLRIKDVDWRNVHGPNLAIKYGIGELVYESKKIYDGSILLKGNPRIKPWDIVFIWDKYNDICGPVEVEQVVEKLSFESGFITEIKPNAVVFANEMASFPVLEGLKAVFGAITKDQDQVFPNYVGESILSNLMTKTWANDVVTTIDQVFYDGQIKNGRTTRDIVEYASYQISEKIGLPANTTIDGDYSVSHNSYTTSQHLFNSGAWLLGGIIYLNKCTEGQSIIVYPLLKNGLPYIAGIPQGRPETIYQIFRGQIKALLNDTSKGTIDYLDYWKLLGFSAIRQFAFSDETKSVATASDKI